MTTGDQALVALWTAAMRAEHQSPKTISRRVGTLRLFQRHLSGDVQAATPDDVAAFIARYPSPATAEAYYGDLRAWWAWLQFTSRAVSDPTRLVRRPVARRGTPRPVSTTQLGIGLAAAAGDIRTLIILMAYGALRVGEAVQVAADDITDTHLLVHGKGRRDAYIPMHPLLQAEAATRPARGLWFPSTRPFARSPHLSSNHVSTTVRVHFETCHLYGITPHRLRHWAATQLLWSGADIREVQAFLRHQSLNSTMIYTLVAPPRLAAAVARLPHA